MADTRRIASPAKSDHFWKAYIRVSGLIPAKSRLGLLTVTIYGLASVAIIGTGKLMDIVTTAQILGNLGEFVGSIAVVATLAFLAFQLRQNTKAIRSQTYTAWASITAISHQMVMASADTLAKITDSNLEWDDLDTRDRFVVRSQFVHLMNTFETSFLNYIDGTIDETIFDAKHRNMLYVFSTNSIYRQLWQMRMEHGGGPWDARFADHINNKVLPVTFPLQGNQFLSDTWAKPPAFQSERAACSRVNYVV